MASLTTLAICLLAFVLACSAAPAEDLKSSAPAAAPSDLKAESSYGLGYGAGPWGGYGGYGGFGYPGYHGYGGYPYRQGWYPGYGGLGYGGYGFGGYPWY